MNFDGPSIECPHCGQTVDHGDMSGVDGLLVCPSCQDMVPVLDQPTNIPGLQETKDEPLEPPSKIDGFEWDVEIGRGAMGVVYAARQVSLNRRVAIKILAPQLADDEKFVARFQREAAILSRLTHPHIVSVYERGEAEGLSYIVMEYVEDDDGKPAKSLRNIIDDDLPDVAESRRLMLQVASALESAHQAGIVHRDLKPGNILVDGRGDTRIVDFGIATVADPEVGEQLTMTNSAIGTPDYMAPEQWKDAHAADSRCDVYAAGVILYELLTGRLPQATRFRPPSELVERLEPEWDRIVDGALEPEPHLRTPTMSELVSRLQSAPVELKPAAEITDLLCDGCNEPVNNQDQFCPSCRVVLWVDCPACQARTSVHTSACHQCNAKIDKIVLFHQYHQSATRAMEEARAELNLDERLQQARKAEDFFQEALRHRNDHDIIDQRGRCQNLIGSLALELAHDMFNRRRLGRARALFEFAGQYGQSSEVADMLTQVEAEREHFLWDARQLAAKSQFETAIVRLRDGQFAFPDDDEISALLEETRNKSQRVASIVHQEIRPLVSQKQFHAVNQLIDKVRDMGVRLDDVERLAKSIERRTEKITPAIRAARNQLDQCQYAEARHRAQRVLKHFSDHVEALWIADEAEKRHQRLSQTTREIDAALNERRWHAAQMWLESLRDEERALRHFQETQQQVLIGLSGSDVATRLKLLALVGAVGFLVAPLVANIFRLEFVGLFSQLDHDPLVVATIAQLFKITLPLVTTAMVAGLLAVRTPVDFAWNGVVGIVIALFSGFLITMVEKAMAEVSVRTGESLEVLTLILSAIPEGLAGATIGLLIAVPLIRLMPVPDWTTCWQTAGTGLFISFTLIGLLDRLLVLPEIAIAGFVLAGLLALGGLSTGWSRVLIVPMTGILAGLVTQFFDIEAVLHLPASWLWWAEILPLAVAAILVSRPFNSSMFLQVVFLTCLVVVLVHVLPAQVDRVPIQARLALWCMVCGSLASVESRQFDHRLHLVDRLRTAWHFCTRQQR